MMVNLRLLFCLVALPLLAACAPKSPYEPGKSAADIPEKIDVIKFDKFAAIDLWKSGDDWEQRIDAAPSTNDQEVMAVAKASVIAQFENFGMHIVEDDSRKPDLKIHVFVGYQPELGYYVHRQFAIGIQVLDADDSKILHEAAGHYNAHGLLDAIFQSRDGMIGDVSRQVVLQTAAELQKGTKATSEPEPVLQPPPTASPPTAPSEVSAGAPSY